MYFHNSQIQWLVVSTLCQEMKHHLNLKVGFEGTLRLDPYWKSQPVTQKVSKYGVEIRIESVNQKKSHSWVRIFRDLNKLVTDLSNKEDDDNEQETSETKTEIIALKTDVFAFANRSTAKAKPKRLTQACPHTKIVPSREKCGLSLNQELNRIKRTQLQKD